MTIESVLLFEPEIAEGEQMRTASTGIIRTLGRYGVRFVEIGAALADAAGLHVGGRRQRLEEIALTDFLPQGLVPGSKSTARPRPCPKCGVADLGRLGRQFLV